jgi:phosphotransferase system HPr-like phosphotransfer protein
MLEIKLDLSNLESLVNFNKELTRISVDMDVSSGRYVVDGKSINGLLSLDLSKPLDCKVYTDENCTDEEVLEVLDAYILK